MRFRRFVFITFTVTLITVSAVVYLLLRDDESLRRVDISTLPDKDIIPHLALPADVRRAARDAKTEQLLDDALRAFFKDRPSLHGLPAIATPEEAMIQATRMLDDQLTLGSHEPVEFKAPFDWSLDPYDDAWRSEFHSLSCVAVLLEAFENAGDESMFALADSIVFDWIEDNPGAEVGKQPSIAGRLESLLRFWEVYRTRPAGGDGSVARLLLSIQQHADWLTEPAGRDDVYFRNDPRGVHADLAVLAAAIALPQMKDEGQWKDIASDRMLGQIHHHFIGDGEPKRSPAEHLAVMGQFDPLRRLLAANAEPPEEALGRALDGMESFAAHVLSPDGALPAIGAPGFLSDSIEITPVDPKLHDQFIYARSAGESGKKPTALDGYFRAGGYAIFRDTWGDDALPASQTTWVNFHAVHHPPEHAKRHDDELSFLIFGVGRPWIVEAGAIQGGDDDNDLRAYAASTAGHNAYVGATARYAPDAPALLVGDMVSTSDLAAARGESLRYTSTRFVRTVVLIRSLRVVIAFDEIAASLHEEEWTGLLHLAPDLAPAIDGLHATCRAPDMPWTMEIVATSGITTNIDTARGERETPATDGEDNAPATHGIQGWIGDEHGDPAQSTTLLFRRPGKEWRAATLFQLHHNEAPAVDEVTLESDPTGHTISFMIGDQQHHVRIDSAEPLTVSHTVVE